MVRLVATFLITFMLFYLNEYGRYHAFGYWGGSEFQKVHAFPLCSHKECTPVIEEKKIEDETSFDYVGEFVDAVAIGLLISLPLIVYGYFNYRWPVSPPWGY